MEEGKKKVEIDCARIGEEGRREIKEKNTEENIRWRKGKAAQRQGR